ncbi:MAG: hypothetical protein U0946_03230 [Patescibacteria group bacterium]|nr:hypothetical protein [Patescibacteria group bacterium]
MIVAVSENSPEVPLIYRQNNLQSAELKPEWLIPEQKRYLFTGFVLPVKLGEQEVELPVMKVAENEAICWLDFRRPDLALAAAPVNAELIMGLPEKSILLIDTASSKSGAEMDMVSGLVKLGLNDQRIQRWTLRGGKRADLEQTGITEMTFIGEDGESELWFAVDGEGNICHGVKCIPITGKATNEAKYFYWTQTEWREMLQIIQANPDRSVVVWDDVYSTGATLTGIEKLIRGKIAAENKLIEQRRNNKSERVEGLISMKHFYKVVTAFEAPEGVEPPSDLHYAVRIPVIFS